MNRHGAFQHLESPPSGVSALRIGATKHRGPRNFFEGFVNISFCDQSPLSKKKRFWRSGHSTGLPLETPRARAAANVKDPKPCGCGKKNIEGQDQIERQGLRDPPPTLSPAVRLAPTASWWVVAGRAAAGGVRQRKGRTAKLGLREKQKTKKQNKNLGSGSK